MSEQYRVDNDKLRELLRFVLRTRTTFLCSNPDCPSCPEIRLKISEARILVDEPERAARFELTTM